MTFFQAFILGIVQGITEFLPISSSGHLVLVPYYLGWDIPAKEAFLFDVLSQVATLAAVFTYFWKDIVAVTRASWQAWIMRKNQDDLNARLGLFIFIASIPAGLVGLLFKSTFEQAFGSPRATAVFLLGTALLLIIGEQIGKRTRRIAEISWKDGLWIGIFQVFALFPGVSRSGATIAGGMTRDLQRPAAARFSFLMSVPIMLAAGFSASLELFTIPSLSTALPPMLVGFVTAAIVGYFSIRWLLGFLARYPVYGFAAYCTLVGILTLIFFEV
jgi:undecaprenyl-diphosphatase